MNPRHFARPLITEREKVAEAEIQGCGGCIKLKRTVTC